MVGESSTVLSGGSAVGGRLSIEIGEAFKELPAVYSERSVLDCTRLGAGWEEDEGRLLSAGWLRLEKNASNCPLTTFTYRLHAWDCWWILRFDSPPVPTFTGVLHMVQVTVNC
jgi:hypothetical protein